MKRELRGIWRWIVIILVAIGIGLNLFYVFQWSFFGRAIPEYSYLFSLFSCFVAPIFLMRTATKRGSRDRIPWYDLLLFLVALGIPTYLLSKGYTPSQRGWEFAAPPLPTALVAIESLLIVEGCRRVAGLPLTIVSGFFLFFPLYSPYMPGLLQGMGYNFLDLVKFMSFSREGLLGMATRSFGELLIAFLVFAVAIQHTGGGEFFIKMASALLGHVRGGPAKVSVVASAAFGTMSGSVVSNVLTTGSVTIPTMKKIGYSATYAGAVEACASMGGALMPPVMGAAAFIMAEFLGVSYFSIVVAAAVPSLLYYGSLFMQLDAYAAKVGLKGLPREELPSLLDSLKEGWLYIVAFLLLMYFLIYMRLESLAPYYATAALLAMAMVGKKTRLNLRKFVSFIEACAVVLVELMVMIAAIGFIVGSLSMTGVGVGFASGMVEVVRGNVYLLLLMGAFIAMILGMGMPSVPVYVFLAMTLAPALTRLGVYPMSAHLFVLYYGIVSFITPPVALAAFAAAGISGADPMRTGFQAMRLGTVKYLLPFFFAIEPALILHGSIGAILHSISTATVGILLLAGGLEGYLIGIGRLSKLTQAAILASGFLLAMPGWETDLAGAIIAVVTIATLKLSIIIASRRQGVARLATDPGKSETLSK